MVCLLAPFQLWHVDLNNWSHDLTGSNSQLDNRINWWRRWRRLLSGRKCLTERTAGRSDVRYCSLKFKLYAESAWRNGKDRWGGRNRSCSMCSEEWRKVECNWQPNSAFCFVADVVHVVLLEGRRTMWEAPWDVVLMRFKPLSMLFEMRTWSQEWWQLKRTCTCFVQSKRLSSLVRKIQLKLRRRRFCCVRARRCCTQQRGNWKTVNAISISWRQRKSQRNRLVVRSHVTLLYLTEETNDIPGCVRNRTERYVSLVLNL